MKFWQKNYVDYFYWTTLYESPWCLKCISEKCGLENKIKNQVEAEVSVISNQIGMKFCKIVLQVNTHWLTGSDFWYDVTLSIYTYAHHIANRELWASTVNVLTRRRLAIAARRPALARSQLTFTVPDPLVCSYLFNLCGIQRSEDRRDEVKTWCENSQSITSRSWYCCGSFDLGMPHGMHAIRTDFQLWIWIISDRSKTNDTFISAWSHLPLMSSVTCCVSM